MNLRSAVITLCGLLLASAALLWLFDDRRLRIGGAGALPPPP